MFQIILLLRKLRLGLNGIEMIHSLTKTIITSCHECFTVIINEYSKRVDHAIVVRRIDVVRANEYCIPSRNRQVSDLINKRKREN